MAATDINSWLSDETFDFDIDSPTISNESGDDEVFIGPLTHKERCVAVAVTEAEQKITHRIEEIRPEQQAQLLRESTLVALKIREKDISLRSTPTLTITEINDISSLNSITENELENIEEIEDSFDEHLDYVPKTAKF